MTGFTECSLRVVAETELLGEELDEGLGAGAGVEERRAPASPFELGEQAARVGSASTGEDDGCALVRQAPGHVRGIGAFDDHDDRPRQPPAHCSTSWRASTASAISTSATDAAPVRSPLHVPSGSWVSQSTSAMRSAVARKASSPVTR